MSGWSSEPKPRPVDDIGPEIFGSDPGIPPPIVPVVICKTDVVEDPSALAELPAPFPVLQGRTVSDEKMEQLRYRPGSSAAGTRDWLAQRRRLVCEPGSSIVSRSSYCYSETEDESACNTEYLRVSVRPGPRKTRTSVLRVDVPPKPSPVVVRGWPPAETKLAPALPAPVGATHRSCGVVTELRLPDLFKPATPVAPGRSAPSQSKSKCLL